MKTIKPIPYYGFTHKVPQWLLPIWRKLFCRIGWHAWDEVSGIDCNYLICDACDRIFDIEIGKDA